MEKQHLCIHDINWFDTNSAIIYLKQINKISKCYLFLDRAKLNHKSKKIFDYFHRHKNNLLRVFLPTESQIFGSAKNIEYI